MKNFLRDLKKLKNQYLEKSIIILNNNYIKTMLNIVFKFQKPLAKVYLYNSWDRQTKKDKLFDKNNLLNNIENNKHDDFTIIEPI